MWIIIVVKERNAKKTPKEPHGSRFSGRNQNDYGENIFQEDKGT